VERTLETFCNMNLEMQESQNIGKINKQVGRQKGQVGPAVVGAVWMSCQGGGCRAAVCWEAVVLPPHRTFYSAADGCNTPLWRLAHDAQTLLTLPNPAFFVNAGRCCCSLWLRTTSS
jgi:hypothetical protein